MNGIVSMGEALVDWVCLNRTLDLSAAREFVKAPGGAPANVAVALARLGYPAFFLGGFAPDLFGAWLRELLIAEGVDVSLSTEVPDSNTRCAYVLTAPDGNRVLKGFTAARCADALLAPAHVPVARLPEAALICFGSVLQASPTGRAAVTHALGALRGTRTLIVYDPNLRLSLWPDAAMARETIVETLSRAHILKLSDDEVTFLEGGADVRAGARALYARLKPALLAVTLGAEGSFFINAQGESSVPGFRVDAVEMTGAGDGFVAGLLGGLWDALREAPQAPPLETVQKLSVERLRSVFTRASAVGALTTTKPGAMSALPTARELDAFIAARAG